MTLLSELYEAYEPLPADMDLNMQFAELEKRMSAAKRGLGFANRLKNPIQKKKHMSMVLSNLNKIRGNLNQVIKQLEQFNNAEQNHELQSDLEFGGGDR